MCLALPGGTVLEATGEVVSVIPGGFGLLLLFAKGDHALLEVRATAV